LQTITAIEKAMEGVEVQALVTTAALRQEFDRYVHMLEARMNMLVVELETSKQAQILKLAQQRFVAPFFFIFFIFFISSH
jgi:uncharacterized membrane protein YqjE